MTIVISNLGIPAKRALRVASIVHRNVGGEPAPRGGAESIRGGGSIRIGDERVLFWWLTENPAGIVIDPRGNPHRDIFEWDIKNQFPEWI